eukprot:8449533-Alexandrium_andersonii.AAC.1
MGRGLEAARRRGGADDEELARGGPGARGPLPGVHLSARPAVPPLPREGALAPHAAAGGGACDCAADAGGLSARVAPDPPRATDAGQRTRGSPCGGLDRAARARPRPSHADGGRADPRLRT